MGMGKYIKYSKIILILSFILLFTNLFSPELKGEEPLRLLVSFEMLKEHNFFIPTLFGEPYFHKPPLYNWTIIFSSFFVGWSEATSRIISILFTGFTGLLIYYFSLRIFNEKFIAILSSVVYVTFLDVLFYYGWIGEMDSAFTFFVFLMMFFQYIGFKENRSFFIVLSGFLAGLIFLFKGFNAYAFFGLTFLVLATYSRSIFSLIKPSFLLSYFLAILIPFLWLISIPDHNDFIETLFGEVSNRTTNNFNFSLFFNHIVQYPLLNIKQTLIASLFVLALLIFKRNKIGLNGEIKLLLLIIALNYVPYIIMAGGNGMYTIHGRHIMPLFPFLAVVLGFILYKYSSKKVLNLFFVSLAGMLVLKVAYNILLHNLSKHKSREKVAIAILEDTNFSKNIAFDKSCIPHKAVAFYIEAKNDFVVKTPKVNKEWEYLISCKKEDYSLFKKYKIKNDDIFLYKHWK